MSRIKEAYSDLAELAMMGKAVPVRSDSEVEFITDYIAQALGYEFSSENFVDNVIRKYHKENVVTHISTCTISGMPCINYCIDTNDGETPAPFKEDYGTGYPCAFCYVLNLVDPVEGMSEFGDCFFEKKPDGYYHRVS